MEDRGMFPSEMVVLMAMASIGQSLSTPLGCPGDVSSDHVDHLYISLVRWAIWGDYFRRISADLEGQDSRFGLPALK